VTPRRSGILCHCHLIPPEEQEPGTNVLFCTALAARAAQAVRQAGPIPACVLALH